MLCFFITIKVTSHINFLHILQYFFMKYFIFWVKFALIWKSWSKYTLCCTMCVLLHCDIPLSSHLCVHYSKGRNFNKDLILAFYASFLGMLKLNSIHNIFTPHVFSANSTQKQCAISTQMNISWNPSESFNLPGLQDCEIYKMHFSQIWFYHGHSRKWMQVGKN